MLQTEIKMFEKEKGLMETEVVNYQNTIQKLKTQNDDQNDEIEKLKVEVLKANEIQQQNILHEDKIKELNI